MNQKDERSENDETKSQNPNAVIKEMQDLEIANVETIIMTQLTERKLRNIYLEPVLIFNNIAISIIGVNITQFLQYQACCSVFHYDEAECFTLLEGSAPSNATDVRPLEIEKLVRPYVSNLQMTELFVGSITSAIISLFIGTWSDRIGRRPVLLIGITGALIGYLISTILIVKCTFVNPWIYVATSLPFVFVGGTCTIMTMVYCVVNEEVPDLEKTIRFFGNEASISFGKMLGYLTGKPLFAASNIIVIYVTATCLMLLSLLFVIFCFKESVKPNHMHTKSRWQSFFYIQDLLYTTFASREDDKRLVILMAIGALFLLSFISNGESKVVYPFVLKHFAVSDVQNTVFNTVNRLNHQLSGTVSLKLFVKVLKLSLPIITLVSLGSALVESLTWASAFYWWQVYLASGLGFFATVSVALFLTIISKSVLVTEGGKIFAVISSLQTLAPLGASIAYTAVFNASLEFYPGLFTILSSVLLILCVILITFILVIQRRTN